jgi:integrase
MRTPKRERIGKHEELRKILGYFAGAEIDGKLIEFRDRALYGLMLFTGCRPVEARMARIDAITPYGEGGAWQKGRTKNKRTQEIPLPAHYMPWLDAWKAIRPVSTSPYVFPGKRLDEPMTCDAVKLRWHELRLILGIHGLWNYDLRRTMVNVMGNELGYDMFTIKAIINHHEGSALSHYYFKSFDSLVKPIREYADWLWRLRQNTVERQPLYAGEQPEGDIKNEADRPVPVPEPPTSRPVSRVIQAPMPIAYRSHRVEREEWPG